MKDYYLEVTHNPQGGGREFRFHVGPPEHTLVSNARVIGPIRARNQYEAQGRYNAYVKYGRNNY